MATLYVSEYSAIPGGHIQCPLEPAIAEQSFTFTSSTQSQPFGEMTRFVRIHTDAICSIAFGLDPTATTAVKRLAKDQTEYFGVYPKHKVAAITNT